MLVATIQNVELGGILSDIKKRKRTKVNGITIEHRKTHVPL